MATDSLSVLNALETQISAYFSDEEKWGGDVVKVVSESVLPEVLSPGGFLNIWEGDPGEPDDILGGFAPRYYSHQFEIDVCVEHGDAATRKELYGALVRGLGKALFEDETLGGIVIGMNYGQPAPSNERVMGGADLKSATLVILIDYETNNKIPEPEEE